MFERFTDRARRVVVLSQEEARLLNHNYIGTEHLLLGLLHEGDGVAARVLTGMGISLDEVRDEVETMIGAGPGGVPAGHIPFTPRSKKVLEFSLREALQLGHNYIGTEHMLLGLIREGNGVGAQVLTKLGADLAGVRQGVIEVLGEYSEQGEERAAYAAPEDQPVPGAWITAAARSGIRPVRCAFCDTPSPECGMLYTGTSGALICLSCVRAAMGASTALPSQWRSFVGRPGAESIEVLAARIEPTGPPPDDEDAARRAIADAYLNSMEVGADGRTLINVEDGVALADCAEQVRIRNAAIAPHVTQTIDHIKFLDATSAAVWVTTLLNGQPPHPGLFQRECRAVFVEGRWKVARDSMGESWRFGGIECPPRRST